MSCWYNLFNEICEYFRKLINSRQDAFPFYKIFVFLEDGDSKIDLKDRIWEY
jgi:hypothetical protein